MSAFKLVFESGGVHLPELGLWLDAREPQVGSEKVFVSHAHADHMEYHREVILTEPTARFMQARMGGERMQHILPFHQPHKFKGQQFPFQMALLPAGHIFGSAMAWIESEGQSLLYTGDFKLREGLSAEPCRPRPADILIMETTYGRPHYRFPAAAEVMQGVVRFCKEALDNDETAVLLGYSLGKSQELLCGLGDAGLPIMLHGSVYKLTEIYQQFGQCFPPYEAYQPQSARGKVLLCPPNVVGSAMLRNLGPTRTAVLTGWAVEPSCRFRYQTDAAFALSDHADFPDLIELVNRVSPNKVYTLHGFAAEFAQTLRDLGIDAQALSEDDQMHLTLQFAGGRHGVATGKQEPAQSQDADSDHAPDSSRLAKTAAFHTFCDTCAAIAATSSKLEKIRLLAEYLKGLDTENLPRVVTWFTGVPFPATENKVLQLGWALLRDALCNVGGISEAELHQIYLKHSDLGETAFEILRDRPNRQPSLSVGAVDQLFQQIYASRGPIAKLPWLLRAFTECSALEAKFLVKILTGDLRIGLKEGLVEDAIAHTFVVQSEEVRQANLLLGNVGETARLAKENKLGTASITPFRPVKFMLASPEETATDIWERRRAAKRAVAVSQDLESREPVASSFWLEDKYDGIRSQLHKVGDRVALYSRDLKEITRTFPEVTDAAQHLSMDVILDGEIVAMRGDTVLPFAELQKRLGRREVDLFMRDEIPIQFVAFDLLWQNGESLLHRPLAERRQTLGEWIRVPSVIRLAQITPASSVEEIEAAFAAARARNNEGLMIKDPSSIYTPGRRGLAWLKLKKALATLDCVVVGAEYGHGKRNKVLSDYTFAVRDESTGELKTIGKAYSGLTDAEIAQLTEHFLKRVIRTHGRYHQVEPDTVLEIAFDRIQPSTRHNSGLAMRFPRIVRIRTDKSVAEIDTLARARQLVSG